MERQSLVVLPPELARPEPPAEGRFLLGIDGGATKTLAAVLDVDSNTVHLGHAGPSNEDAIGPVAAVRALLAAAGQAMRGAGITDGDLGGAVLAVAGTDTASVADHLHRTRTEAWTVVNDVVGAWATATGTADGVAVIAGTGSNAFGVGPKGPWRPGAGVICSMTRAAPTGSDWSRSRRASATASRRAADRPHGCPRRVLRGPQHRGAGEPRLLQAADQVRDRRLRRRERRDRRRW